MKNTRTAEQIIDEIIAYFDGHEDIYIEATEELDTYNGYLGDDRYYSMDELDELYNGTEPSEILARAFYGYDEETWTTDASGNREYGPFNPTKNGALRMKKETRNLSIHTNGKTTKRRGLEGHVVRLKGPALYETSTKRVITFLCYSNYSNVVNIKCNHKQRKILHNKIQSLQNKRKHF